MKIEWAYGEGPTTLGGLADEVEREGRLVVGSLIDGNGERCLWGVLENVERSGRACRTLDFALRVYLMHNGLNPSDNNSFAGTPEERCQEMVRRMRKLDIEAP